MEISRRNYKETTTHMPLLIKCVQDTDGPILELGSGFFSTPLLHWLCAEDRRQLITYESNEEYYDYAQKFKSKNHKVRLVENWDEIEIEQPWDVVLIDHDQFRRSVDAIRVKNYAKYVILHDTDRPWTYDYDSVWPHFNYIFHWKFCRPFTSVLSNYERFNDNNTRS